METEGRFVFSMPVWDDWGTVQVNIHRAKGRYVATWKCSCGAIESEVMQSTSPADAAELGRVNYKAHCTAAHPVI